MATDYAKKKNDELAALCKERNLPHTGKKADLVKRLEEYDAKNAAAPAATTNDDEIDFAIQIFRELVEPTLTAIEHLFQPGVYTRHHVASIDSTRHAGVVRDSVWRNDVCRHLSLVRNAFAGTPTLVKEFISPVDAKSATETTDML